MMFQCCVVHDVPVLCMVSKTANWTSVGSYLRYRKIFSGGGGGAGMVSRKPCLLPFLVYSGTISPKEVCVWMFLRKVWLRRSYIGLVCLAEINLAALNKAPLHLY